MMAGVLPTLGPVDPIGRKSQHNAPVRLGNVYDTAMRESIAKRRSSRRRAHRLALRALVEFLHHDDWWCELSDQAAMFLARRTAWVLARRHQDAVRRGELDRLALEHAMTWVNRPSAQKLCLIAARTCADWQVDVSPEAAAVVGDMVRGFHLHLASWSLSIVDLISESVVQTRPQRKLSQRPRTDSELSAPDPSNSAGDASVAAAVGAGASDDDEPTANASVWRRSGNEPLLLLPNQLLLARLWPRGTSSASKATTPRLSVYPFVDGRVGPRLYRGPKLANVACDQVCVRLRQSSVVVAGKQRTVVMQLGTQAYVVMFALHDAQAPFLIPASGELIFAASKEPNTATVRVYDAYNGGEVTSWSCDMPERSGTIVDMALSPTQLQIVVAVSGTRSNVTGHRLMVYRWPVAARQDHESGVGVYAGAPQLQQVISLQESLGLSLQSPRLSTETRVVVYPRHLVLVGLQEAGVGNAHMLVWPFDSDTSQIDQVHPVIPVTVSPSFTQALPFSRDLILVISRTGRWHVVDISTCEHLCVNEQGTTRVVPLPSASSEPVYGPNVLAVSRSASSRSLSPRRRMFPSATTCILA